MASLAPFYPLPRTPLLLSSSGPTRLDTARPCLVLKPLQPGTLAGCRPSSSPLALLPPPPSLAPSSPALTMVLLAAPHPLDPSTAEELSAAVSLIKGLYSPDVLLHFKVAGLQEPPKKTLLAYLAAEKAGQQPAPLPRLVSA